MMPCLLTCQITTTVIFALVLTCLLGPSSVVVAESNILVLSPITTPSHSNFFKPVVKALADRGHYITYWNGLKTSNKLKTTSSNNVNFLYSSPQLGRINSDHNIRFDDRDSPYRLLFDIPMRMANYCTAIYQDPIFHQLIKSKNEYNLLIIEGAFNECLLPLVRILDVPFIYMIGFTPTPWLMNSIGSSLAFDHFPHPGSNYVDKMGLWQRFFNAFSGFVIVYFHRWFVMSVVDRTASEMLNISKLNQMPADEIQNQYLSLLMSNTHFSINYQLPTSAAEIQVGGLHCVPPNPLPEDLESFVSGAGEAGFIIVSFGSILRSDGIPDVARRIFLSTFARLSQRVVWKWEDEEILNDDVPSNVRLISWMPQQDLLGHSNIRFFITHCGLFSNQEAVYHGVPFIALPVFADQPINAQKAQDDGYAIRLNWDDLTEETLYNAIQLILTDSRYAEKMEKVSALMRDQIEHPLARAVYWIEYVIRHRGAAHLRTAARNLSLYQRCLVDVMFLFTLIAIFLFYLSFRLFHLTCRRVNLKSFLQFNRERGEIKKTI